jgi:lipopolysaccharide/colanic/teichoic acid biosynthesis glycosyltransferase
MAADPQESLAERYGRLARESGGRRGVDLALRTLDLLIAGIALLLLSLVAAVIAAVLLLTSGRPIFYGGERVGRYGRVFRMRKFRTLRADAESRLGPYYGAELDARTPAEVTRVGRWLRASQLDEVPQLWNVLRGEMSLVGPRPLPLRDYAQLEAWHRKRYLVLPGITGLWQISGRSNLGFDDLVRLDFYYLENWSLWLDISILAKTIPAVVRARGAY